MLQLLQLPLQIVIKQSFIYLEIYKAAQLYDSGQHTIKAIIQYVKKWKRKKKEQQPLKSHKTYSDRTRFAGLLGTQPGLLQSQCTVFQKMF